MKRMNIFGLTISELEDFVRENGLPRFRAEQLYRGMYSAGATTFDALTTLPKEQRAQLAGTAFIGHPIVDRVQQSVDGTRKYLLRLDDGRAVEAVLIPSADAGKRLTLCMSTQVGCALGCAFCATASMKLGRSMTAGEILGQYYALRSDAGGRITNLVLMGMGEPLLNLDAVESALDILEHEKNDAVAAPRITISTVGVLPGIVRLADENRREKLAISLHATTNEQRSAIIPLNRKYNLEALRDTLAYYFRKTRRAVTFEYILFDQFNDGPDDVRRLVKLTRAIPSKINLIPFHAIADAYGGTPPAALTAAPPDRLAAFADALRAQDVVVMRRSSAGEDIDAACGQLAVKNLESHN